MKRRAEASLFTPSRVRGSSSLDGFKFLLAVALMLGGMLFAWFHVGPSGQRMDQIDIILFSLREFLLLGFFFIVGIFICLAWLCRLFVRWRGPKKSQIDVS